MWINKTFTRVVLISFLLITVLCVILFLGFVRAKNYIEQEFHITDVKVDFVLSEFLQGSIPKISFKFARENLALRASGPLRFQRKESKKLELNFKPEITIEVPKLETHSVHAEINALLPTSFSGVDRLDFVFEAPTLKMLSPAIEIQKLHANGSLQGRVGNLKVNSVSWLGGENSSAGFELKNLVLRLTTPEENQYRLEMRAEKADALWNGKFLTVELKKFPMRFDAQLYPECNDIRKSSFKWSGGDVWQLALAPIARCNEKYRGQWSLKPTFPRAVLDLLTPWLGNWSARVAFDATTRIQTEGGFEFDSKEFDLRTSKIDGYIRANGNTLNAVSRVWAIKSFDVQLPLVWTPGVATVRNGWMQAQTIYWKRLQFGFPRSPISVEVKDETINANLRSEVGWLGQTTVSYSKGDWALATAFNRKGIDVRSVFQAFCISEKWAVPGTLNIDLPEILVDSSLLHLKGEAVVNLFGGSIRIFDVEAFDWLGEGSEWDLSLDWKDIQLNQLGALANFGEMDGLLEGHALDLVLQSGFPTEYEFMTRVRPHHHSDVVFSPDAMKNFVRLFTGDDLSRTCLE